MLLARRKSRLAALSPVATSVEEVSALSTPKAPGRSAKPWYTKSSRRPATLLARRPSLAALRPVATSVEEVSTPSTPKAPGRSAKPWDTKSETDIKSETMQAWGESEAGGLRARRGRRTLTVTAHMEDAMMKKGSEPPPPRKASRPWTGAKQQVQSMASSWASSSQQVLLPGQTEELMEACMSVTKTLSKASKAPRRSLKVSLAAVFRRQPLRTEVTKFGEQDADAEDSGDDLTCSVQTTTFTSATKLRSRFPRPRTEST